MEERLRERRKYYNDLRAGYDDYGFGSKNRNILNNIGEDNSRHMTENNKSFNN